MKRLKIAVADSVFPNLDPTEEIFGRAGGDVTLAEAPTKEAILKIARDSDALMVTFAELTADLISELRNCRAIGRFGIGVNNIDLDAAHARDIQICYVPDYCLDEVADHSLALMLALERKVVAGNAQVQAGGWALRELTPMRRLRGLTLGLVGFGKIPQNLAPKARAFGLNIVVADPYAPESVIDQLGATRVSFEELLVRSDFISVHAPLTEETRHIFSESAFKQMKSSAYLINTSRGPLIDEGALAAALDAGELAGAGLDVLESEPLAEGFGLSGRDNVIITPHAAFYSESSLLDLQTKCCEDVVRILRGDAPLNPANKL